MTGAVSFCRWCGQKDCGQKDGGQKDGGQKDGGQTNGGQNDGAGGCRSELDPPRFCPTCGRRLRVLVTPRRVEARCRDHGPVDDAVPG